MAMPRYVDTGNWNQDETLGPRRTRKKIIKGIKKREND
jgi:hypothetical protein